LLHGCPIPIPPWNCPSIPPPAPATNVLSLHPGNIKAVMAMGDSISAGFGMIGYPPEDLLEWRNYVFSTGAASAAFTIFNNFKKYSPSVAGGSESWTWPHPSGVGAWLNAAVSHSSVQDLPSQVDFLVSQLQTVYKGKVDFNNDWKLLTIFIGANNLCSACEGRDSATPKYFGDRLREVLTQIEAKIPRVFVNLVTIFNVSGVYYAGKDYWYCETIWAIIKHECYCVKTGKKSDLDAMDIDAVQYNQISLNLAQEFAGHNNPGFTVVVQPGLSGIDIAKYGEAYLSELDCFHPSLCANQAFTYQIWNNMFTPIGQKSTVPDPNNLVIKCPTVDSVLQ